MTKVGNPEYRISTGEMFRARMPIEASALGGSKIGSVDGSLALLFEVQISCPFCGEASLVKTHPHVVRFDERGERTGDRYRLRNHISGALIIFSQGRFCDDCGINFRIVGTDAEALKADLSMLSLLIEPKLDGLTGYVSVAG